MRALLGWLACRVPQGNSMWGHRPGRGSLCVHPQLCAATGLDRWISLHEAQHSPHSSLPLAMNPANQPSPTFHSPFLGSTLILSFVG